MEIIIMTEERIHSEYEELSRALLKSDDKDIRKDTHRCGKAFGVSGRGELIKNSSDTILDTSLRRN